MRVNVCPQTELVGRRWRPGLIIIIRIDSISRPKQSAEKISPCTFWRPPNLFISCSPLIPTHLYMRASSCLFSPCHAHITAAAFLHSCRIGLQTRRHLSSSQTQRHHNQQAKNCVAPLMKATDARPLVSTPPCLHSAPTLLFSYLYENETLWFFFFFFANNTKSDAEAGEGIFVSCLLRGTRNAGFHE